jgi:hypothetical protein
MNMNNQNIDNLNGNTGTSSTNPVKNSALFPTGEGGSSKLGSFISKQPTGSKKVNVSVIGESSDNTTSENGSTISGRAGTVHGVNMSFSGKPEAAPTANFTGGAFGPDYPDGDKDDVMGGSK